jgi:hypothetical protein
MNDKWKYIGSSAMPLSMTLCLAYAVNPFPVTKQVARTLVMVSGATFFNRIIFSMISPNVDSWKDSKNRYSTQVSISTGVGLTTSLLSSVYDGTPLNTSSINVSASTFGSWVIGNLIWLSDAVVLGENTALKPENLVPEFYV